MGGRYGGSDDGSDEYQDRRPKDDDLADEQQTVAEAVHAVAEQQSADGESSSGHDTDGGHRADRGGGDGGNDSDSSSGSGQHPFTSLRPGSSTSGSATLQDVDQTIAEYVADQLTESVEQAVEETDPDE